MAQSTEPTIKGVFLNSHIGAVRDAKGDAGITELTRRFGQPIDFKNTDDVPVRDEIKLIEYVLEILRGVPVPIRERAFEAGRLHFRDFITTPLARMMLKVFPTPRVLLHIKSIAEHIFIGISFTTEDLGPTKLRIKMHGGHYPLEHFKGLFYEWIVFYGFNANVIAVQMDPETYEYTLEWTEKK